MEVEYVISSNDYRELNQYWFDWESKEVYLSYDDYTDFEDYAYNDIYFDDYALTFTGLDPATTTDYITKLDTHIFADSMEVTFSLEDVTNGTQWQYKTVGTLMNDTSS